MVNYLLSPQTKAHTIQGPFVYTNASHSKATEKNIGIDFKRYLALASNKSKFKSRETPSSSQAKPPSKKKGSH
jgi:hypothetical protein